MRALLLALSLAWLGSAEPITSKMPLTEKERGLLQRESEAGWKSVQWAQDAAAAVRRAQAEGKPIAVFLVVGEFGKSGAPTC